MKSHLNVSVSAPRIALAARAPAARLRGFTLIEVMVVAAIVAILTAIAYPSYTEYLRRGYRAEAQATLHDANQYMQRFLAAHNRYDQQRDGTAVALASDLTQSPRTGVARYQIVIASASTTRYTLEARPTGASASDPCGVLVLTSLGQRNVRAASRPAAECWR